MKMQKTVGNRTKFKNCKQGYSWTTLFFSFLVPLFRGMTGWYIAKVWIFGIFTLSLSNIYFGFKINDDYYEHLIDEGYTESK